MFSYVWPIALVVLSNVVYQICCKSIPENVSPFATLTITYLVGAVVSAIMFFVTEPKNNILKHFVETNWASYVLGLIIVGLEVGFIYAYKAGWQVSTASIVQSSFLTIALIIVGAVLYHEEISWNKLVGAVVCMIGLVFINMK